MLFLFVLSEGLRSTRILCSMKAKINLTGDAQPELNRSSIHQKLIRQSTSAESSSSVDSKIIIPKSNLGTGNVIDVAVRGIEFLPTLLNKAIGEVTFVIVAQILSVSEYLDMLCADPVVSAEKDAYMAGANDGTLIAVWPHLELLGNVLSDAAKAQRPVGAYSRPDPHSILYCYYTRKRMCCPASRNCYWFLSYFILHFNI